MESVIKLVTNTVKNRQGGMSKSDLIQSLRNGGIKATQDNTMIELRLMLSMYFFGKHPDEVDADEVLRDAKKIDGK